MASGGYPTAIDGAGLELVAGDKYFIRLSSADGTTADCIAVETLSAAPGELEFRHEFMGFRNERTFVYLPPATPDKDTLALRVDRELHDQLRAYAEFLGSTKEYIVTSALRRVFRHDKDFIAWQHTRNNEAASTVSGRADGRHVEWQQRSAGYRCW